MRFFCLLFFVGPCSPMNEIMGFFAIIRRVKFCRSQSFLCVCVCVCVCFWGVTIFKVVFYFIFIILLFIYLFSKVHCLFFPSIFPLFIFFPFFLFFINFFHFFFFLAVAPPPQKSRISPFIDRKRSLKKMNAGVF